MTEGKQHSSGSRLDKISLIKKYDKKSWSFRRTATSCYLVDNIHVFLIIGAERNYCLRTESFSVDMKRH